MTDFILNVENAMKQSAARPGGNIYRLMRESGRKMYETQKRHHDA